VLQDSSISHWNSGNCRDRNLSIVGSRSARRKSPVGIHIHKPHNQDTYSDFHPSSMRRSGKFKIMSLVNVILFMYLNIAQLGESRGAIATNQYLEKNNDSLSLSLTGISCQTFVFVMMPSCVAQSCPSSLSTMLDQSTQLPYSYTYVFINLTVSLLKGLNDDTNWVMPRYLIQFRHSPPCQFVLVDNYGFQTVSDEIKFYGFSGSTALLHQEIIRANKDYFIFFSNRASIKQIPHAEDVRYKISISSNKCIKAGCGTFTFSKFLAQSQACNTFRRKIVAGKVIRIAVPETPAYNRIENGQGAGPA